MRPFRRALGPLFLLLALPSLLPGQSPAPAPGGPDRIRLVTGEELRGKIIGETDKLVRIRIGKGMVLGVEKKRTLQIIRTSSPAPRKAGEGIPRLLEPRDLHFLVLDRKGKVVGCRRMLVKEEDRPDGSFVWLLEEKWFFNGQSGPTKVYRSERVSPLLAPLECFYREVWTRGDRVVKGVVKGEEIQVQTLSPAGRRKSCLPFMRGTRFPLLLREILRQKERTARQEITSMVYDPMEDCFRRDVFVTGERRGPIAGPFGKWGTVFVLREKKDGRWREEWLDAEGRTLYMEVNGLDLVALACSAEEERRVEAGLPPARPVPALVQGKNPSLRLPDPGWAFLDGRRAFARSADLGATLKGMTVPGTGPETPLAEAARILARNLSLGKQPLSEVEFLRRQVGWVQAVSLEGRIGPKGGTRVRALVFPGPGGPMALVLQGPSRTWKTALACLEKTAPYSLVSPVFSRSPAAPPR